MDLRMRLRIFLRSLLLQSCWSFERMQSLGFAHCLQPWLEKLYRGRPEELQAAMARHQDFFNTQPYVASVVIGTVCSLEEEVATLPEEQRPAKVARIKALKTGAAAALAGLGDAFFWGTLRPCCAALALCAALAGPLHTGALRGATAYLAAYNLFSLGLRWNGLRLGYEWKDKLAVKLKELPLQDALRSLRLTGGVLALGAGALGLGHAPSQRRFAAMAAVAVFLALRIKGAGPYRLYAGACAAGMTLSAFGWL